MIVARIDNSITARTPRRRGRSFKGALRYLLRGARDAPNPERVLYAETVNILSDLADAAHDMATTWEGRFRLMRTTGISAHNGADNTAPVYHAVLSWTPEEDPPSPTEMAEHAKQLLHLLGLGEHEAVLVVHGDTVNPHIHIIVNTVHPITGRTAPLRFDKRIMQGFAARYEEQRGKIVCQGRFVPDAKGAFSAAAGNSYARRRENRPRWERREAPIAEAKRAALPSVILDALTRHDATFTPARLAQAVTEATANPAEFSELMHNIQTSPELVRLVDTNGGPRYTTRAQQLCETRLAESAARLAGSTAHMVSTAIRTAALSSFAGSEQIETRLALEHLLDERGLSIVVGYAGAGKSTLLREAARAWHDAGFACRGLALAGRAAEGLAADAGIPSGTIAGFLMALDGGHVTLSSKDVLVIDEAGMVASRQLDRLLRAARDAGAKVVLVGDPEQLQAIEAGGPFRYLLDHYDHARLTTIWRQKADWMRQATRDLAEGRTAPALAAYRERGMVQGHATKPDAVEAMLDMWLANRERVSQLMLTATNADAALINRQARARLHAMTALGPEVVLETTDGPQPFAVGDRVVFRRNDKALGVKNGTVGTLTEILGTRLTVATDGRPQRIVALDIADYPHIAHGYAVTIHKSQGATVDRVYVLAAANMDRHSAYVALSRHRDRVSLHWCRDDFPKEIALVRRLSRARLKDVTLDYREALATGLRAVAAALRARRPSTADMGDWAALYRAQREEADRVAAMSPLRRAFWMATHLPRFLRAGATSLAKLHERERVLIATLRRNASASKQGRVTRSDALSATPPASTGRPTPPPHPSRPKPSSPRPS